MTDNRVTVSFTIDSGYGPSEFRQDFADAELALAFLNGYLGIYACHITGFRVEMDYNRNG